MNFVDDFFTAEYVLDSMTLVVYYAGLWTGRHTTLRSMQHLTYAQRQRVNAQQVRRAPEAPKLVALERIQKLSLD